MPLIVPAKTSSPLALSTGALSPVMGAWLTALMPSITVPSSPKRSPGATRTDQPDCTWLAGMRFQLTPSALACTSSGTNLSRLSTA